MSSTELLIAGHLLLAFFSAGIAWVRALFRRDLDYLSFLLIVFSIFYGFVPAGLHIASQLNLEYRWTYEVTRTDYGYGSVLALAYLAMLCLLAGWFGAQRLSLPRLIVFPRWLDASTAFPTVDHGRLVRLAWVLLIVSMAFMYVYTRAYGGFLGGLEMAPTVRAGVVEIDNTWSFFQPLGGFALFSAFLFFGLICNDQTVGRLTHNWFGLVLSVIASFYVLLIWGGRLNLAIFLAVFLLARTTSPKRKLLTRSALVGGITITGIYVGQFILRGARDFLQTGTWASSLDGPGPWQFFLNELGFAIVSVAASSRAVYGGLVELRYFADFPMAFAYVLPDRWTGLRARRPLLSQVHTEQVDEAIAGGTVPPDLVSLGLYSLGVPGVVLLCLVFGAVAVWLERYMRKLGPVGVRRVLMLAVGLRFSTLLVYADPTFMLRNNIYLIIGVLLLHHLYTWEQRNARNT